MPRVGDALEPEVEVLLVRPPDAPVYLGRNARNLASDLRHVRKHVARHQRRLGGQRVEAVGRVPEQRPRGLELGDHFRAHVLHGLERADQTIELLAFLRIGDSLLDHRLAGAQRIGGQRDAPGLEHARDGFARGLEDGLGGDSFERELCRAAGRIDGLQARHLEARRVALHDDERVGVDRDHQQIRGAGIDRHHRLAVQLARLQRDTGVFTHGKELRRCDTEDRITACDLRQPGLRLTPAQRGERSGDHDRGREKGCRRRGVAQRLRDQRGVEQRQAGAPLRLGHQHARHTQLRELAPDRAIVRAVLFPQLAHALDRHPVCQKAPDCLFEQQLIVRKSEIHLVSPQASFVSPQASSLRPSPAWARAAVRVRALR